MSCLAWSFSSGRSDSANYGVGVLTVAFPMLLADGNRIGFVITVGSIV